MIKGRQQLKIVQRRGATAEEAFQIVATLQDREIARLTAENERLNGLVAEAITAMDQDEADKFFGVA
jgi:hypothetical protein